MLLLLIILSEILDVVTLIDGNDHLCVFSLCMFGFCDWWHC